VRIQRSQTYPILLAGLFVLAALNRRDLPGEEILPELYRRAVVQPLLVPALGVQRSDETARLRNELDVARRELAETREQLAKAMGLAAHLETLDGWSGRTHRLLATVLFEEPERDGIRAFRVDRGARDGVRVGMAVADGVALAGVVSRVADRQAVVQRVDDPNFRIEVEVRAGGGAMHGIAYGDGGGLLDLRFLRLAEGLLGACVFTTAYRPDVPSGLLLGRVEAVRDLDRDEVMEASVRSAAFLRPLARVEVIWRE
jgi:cell shape-determining protein MreC